MGMPFYRTTAAALAWWTASGLTVLLLLTGCDSGSGGGSSGSQDNVQPSGVGVSTGKHPKGLFQSGGDGGCEVKVPAGRHVAEPLQIERLHSTSVCFLGFRQPIEVELTGPGAGDRVVEDSFVGEWYVNTRGDMRRGTYGYRAAPKLAGSSSGGQVTGIIRVVPAREPSVHKMSDTAPSGGRGLQIALAGYPAGSCVQAFLYGPKGTPLLFVRALPQAIIGADGEAMYTWQARGDDPLGTYAIWFNPGGTTSGFDSDLPG